MLISLALAMTTAQLPPAEIDRLVAKADKGDVRALNTLGRARSKPVTRRLCPGLTGLAADAPATAARLGAIAAAPDAKCAKPVSAWLARVDKTTGPVPRRSLRAAVRFFAAVPPVEGGVGALAKLARHPDADIADAALGAFAKHEALGGGAHVEIWIGALRTGRPAATKAALTLLVRAKAKTAVEAILQSGLREAEANPMRGAPEHVAALRAITGTDRGSKIEAWR